MSVCSQMLLILSKTTRLVNTTEPIRALEVDFLKGEPSPYMNDDFSIFRFLPST